MGVFGTAMAMITPDQLQELRLFIEVTLDRDWILLRRAKALLQQAHKTADEIEQRVKRTITRTDPPCQQKPPHRKPF
jgi:hypothetical protein